MSEQIKWIINRSIEDIEYLRTPKLDIGRLESKIGALNYEDLNRISNNLVNFIEFAKQNGYFASDSELRTNWVESDIPYFEDINDIRTLATQFKKLYNVESDIVYFTETLDFKQMNTIERIFFKSLQYNNNVGNLKIYCDEYECGEV